MTAVLHLAAVFRTRDDDLIWNVNREGTRNLISTVQQHAPQARFLLASTSNVYGDNSPHPGREDDPVNPALAYPASKIEAENLLRASGLTWAILRLPFIYGDQDGHLESLPGLAAEMGWHPARKLSVVHHADIATAFKLALTGTFDGRTVNIADELPLSIYEVAQIVGYLYGSSAAPLTDPWRGQMDVTLARSLGFIPTVSTIYQAVRQDLL